MTVGAGWREEETTLNDAELLKNEDDGVSRWSTISSKGFLTKVVYIMVI